MGDTTDVQEMLKRAKYDLRAFGTEEEGILATSDQGHYANYRHGSFDDSSFGGARGQILILNHVGKRFPRRKTILVETFQEGGFLMVRTDQIKACRYALWKSRKKKKDPKITPLDEGAFGRD